jgi:hypothetical protein
MVCSAQIVHLCSIKIVSISKWNEIRFYMTQVTKQFYRVRPKQFLGQWYARHEPCTYLESRLELSPLEPRHLGVSSGANGTLAQTMHLSCTDTNVVSKQTEMRFHKSHIT